MNEISLNALDPQLGKLVSNARTALTQGDAAYAREVLSEVMAQAPGCAAARRLWWQALRADSAPSGGWMQQLKNRFKMGAQPVVGQDPVASVVAADRVLAKNSARVDALRQVAAAAKVLGWTETECFALEAWVSVQPREKASSLAWIEALQRHARFDDALKAVDALLALYPNDGDAQSAKRDLGVARTMRQGGWEDDGSFRGKLRQ